MSFKNILRKRAIKSNAVSLLNNLHISEILHKPVITEKALKLAEWHPISTKKTFVFYVDLRSNKNDIKNAIKALYNVPVDSINIVHEWVKWRSRRPIVRRERKKAYITLSVWSSIDLS
jgi:large subunit ribosomal protein L23